MRGRQRTLPDQTSAYTPELYLKFALEAEEAWHALLTDLTQADSLPSFLDYVARKAPFYHQRFPHRPVDRLDLSSFPVAGHSDHRRHPEQFLAGLRDVRLCASTNGTIAPQLRVQFDPAGWYELNFGTYAAVASVIPGLLSHMIPGVEGVFLVTNAVHQPRMSVYIPPLNAALLCQLVIGRSTKEDHLTVDCLRAEPVPLLYGKPSNLLQLASLDAHAPPAAGRIQAHAILVSGESLYADQRRKLEDWFRCPVLNAYIATEGGLIAIECPHRTGLHVRSKFVQVEVVTAGGDIQDCGHGDILITSLFNRAHAFVRYELGDEIESVLGTCPCGFTGQTIARLLGRECARFHNGQGDVSSEVFAEFLTQLPLKEFQVSQAARDGPVLKWVPEDRGIEAVGRLNAAIAGWLAEHGWQSWVSALPLESITPPGGKQRRFVRSQT